MRLLLVLGWMLLVQVPHAHAISVFDSANFGQNLLTAARSLSILNNQIRELANQVRMIETMDQNLLSLAHDPGSELRASREALADVLGRAEDLAWDVDQMEAMHERLYPEVLPAGSPRSRHLQLARERWRVSREAWRHTLEVQAHVIDGLDPDEALLEDLLRESQGARGALEVNQAANQIQVLQVRQQYRSQALLAARDRAEALDRARTEAAARQARVRFADSIGDGQLYHPLP